MPVHEQYPEMMEIEDLMELIRYAQGAMRNKVFPFIANDGGRAKAGFPSDDSEGDCVVRAICNTGGFDYARVHRDCGEVNLRSERMLVRLGLNIGPLATRAPTASIKEGVITASPFFDQYMHAMGYRAISYEKTVDGAVHWEALAGFKGKGILRLGDHATSLVDGKLVDTFDAQLRYGWIYEMWVLD